MIDFSAYSYYYSGEREFLRLLISERTGGYEKNHEYDSTYSFLGAKIYNGSLWSKFVSSIERGYIRLEKIKDSLCMSKGCTKIRMGGSEICKSCTTIIERIGLDAKNLEAIRELKKVIQTLRVLEKNHGLNLVSLQYNFSSVTKLLS